MCPRTAFGVLYACPMNLPIALTIAYLAINVAMMLWLENERSNGRRPSRGVSTLAIALRFGPPLLGAIYLELIAGDWLFLVFVAAFFAASFWLMDGLLTVSTPTRGSDPMRSGWDDRGAGASSGTERERS
jgi:hypothetical protein